MSKNIFEDITLEQGVIKGLTFLSNLEFDIEVEKLRDNNFADDAHKKIFAILKNMNARGITHSFENIKIQMQVEQLSIEPLIAIMSLDNFVSLDYAIGVLIEYTNKRTLQKELENALKSLEDGDSSFSVANKIALVADSLTLSANDDFRSYSELKAEFASLPPMKKIKTGIEFIDTKLKNGIIHGQLILLMGDPESGKTVLATQIAKNVSNREPVLFMPFEFSSRDFIEKNIKNEDRFNMDNFFMESELTDILDIEQRIKMFARKGGKLIVIDSQMMVKNISCKGTSEEIETEKFHILARLCIRYELVVIFICQQGKEDTKGGNILPMKSKLGGHAAHQIWYVRKQKPKFDENGEDLHKFERDFVMDKNKQNGNHFSKPIKLDNFHMEFSGRHYDEDDTRRTKPKPKAKYEVAYEMSNI